MVFYAQEILDDVADIDLVVNLKLPESVLIEKCLGRRVCSECGKNYNVASIDVKGENGKPGITMEPLLPPPECALKLITRADDTEAVVKERLRIYNDKVSPMLTLSSVKSIWNFQSLLLKRFLDSFWLVGCALFILS